MTDNKVQELFYQYGRYIPEDKMIMFRNALKNASDSKYANLLVLSLKSPMTTLLLSILLGGLGMDRFYIGDIGLGLGKLLLGWLTLGIWPLIDIFCSYKKAKETNFQQLLLALS